MISVPSGVWAIASSLGGVPAAKAWADRARSADAWTFRNPACGDGEALACLRALSAEATFLAVHGRSDWARVGGADALIGGWKSLPWEQLREQAPEGCLGLSVHEPEEMEQAVDLGASFVFFGPVWPTPEKAGILKPKGLDGLRRACSFGVPVLALGGILEAGQAQECREAGAHGVAVLRGAGDPDQLASILRGWWGEEGRPPRGPGFP